MTNIIDSSERSYNVNIKKLPLFSLCMLCFILSPYPVLNCFRLPSGLSWDSGRDWLNSWISITIP